MRNSYWNRVKTTKIHSNYSGEAVSQPGIRLMKQVTRVQDRGSECMQQRDGNRRYLYFLASWAWSFLLSRFSLAVKAGGQPGAKPLSLCEQLSQDPSLNGLVCALIP